MEKDITLSTRVPEELAMQIDKLCNVTERSRSWHFRQAMQRYLTDEMEFIAKVEEGIAAADRGQVVPHDDVVAELQRRKKQWQN